MPFGQSARSLTLRDPRGSYTSAEGPYRDIVFRLGNKYPNLIQEDRKRWETNFNYPSRAAHLDFDSNGRPRKEVFVSLSELKNHLNSTSSTAARSEQRRLYILEGTNADYVETLGTALGVDPNVFLRHKRTALWENSHQTGNTPPLPSLIDPQHNFLMEYGELLYFKAGLKSFSMRNVTDECGLAVTRLLDGKFDRVGISHKKASFWARKVGKAGWDAVIIVDEPAREFFAGRRDTRERIVLATEPYQGGYADFIKYDTISDATTTRGPPRSSIFDDLCCYWEFHGNLLNISESPISATLFLQKIVASHYILLSEYNRAILNQFKWILSRRETYAGLSVKWVEERWSDLHALHRRCEDYHRYLQSIILCLEVEENTQVSPDWSNASRDFIVLEQIFAGLEWKSESLISSLTGLAGIVGNRQALAESRSVRVLSMLGMTFLPLSFTSSLFSMADKYLPGASMFWVYFAVAVPLIFVTFVLPFFINLGYEPVNEDSAEAWFGTFWKKVCPGFLGSRIESWKEKKLR